MRVVVDTAQPLRIDVRVHLRRRQRAVPEQLLDRAQVGAALEQVRREGVTQTVRVWHETPKSARVQPPSARGEEQCVLGATRELGPRVSQVAGEPQRRLLTERNDAVLRTLAVAHVYELLLEVDVTEIEADRLRAAESGRINELDESAVPER